MAKTGDLIKVDAFLPDTINTFSTSSRTTVNSLIRQMKVDKTDMQGLINKLSSFGTSSNYSSSRIAPLSRLNTEILVDTFRDSSLRMRRMFSAANAVGIILSSMIDVFFSDIKKIEDDLSKMESYLDNYEFISGKDDLFNLNHVEKFDSLTDSYIYEDSLIALSDRDGVNFPPGGNCYIDSQSGTIKIGSSLNRINLINNVESINILNNYSSNVTTSTDIQKIFNDNKSESWTVTVKSPSIINSNLESLEKYLTYDYSFLRGAQTEVEIKLSSPVEIDCIKIDPNKSNGLSLLQLVIYGSDISSNSASVASNEFVENKILSSPRLLDKYSEISFSRILTNKIIFIFNQANYLKNTIPPIYSEIISKGIASYISKKLVERRSAFSLYQDMVYWHFLKNSTVKGLRKSATATDDYYSNRFPQVKEQSFVDQIEEALKQGNAAVEDIETYKQYNILADYIKSIFAGITFDKKVFESNFYVESSTNRSLTFNAQAGSVFVAGNSNLRDPIYLQFDEPIYSNQSSISALGSFFSDEKVNQYEYSFSLNSIDLCISNQSDTKLQKGCFISKRIGDNNQVIAVKAKVKASDAYSIFSNNDYDLKESMSYELSVSNSARPSTEQDWIPVVPSNISRIGSEILFIGSDLRANLRFKAKTGTVTLYKDGKYVNPSLYNYRPSDNSIRIIDTTLVRPENIIVASYDLDFQQYDYNQVDLLSLGKFKESIKTYIGVNGQGERFISTNSDRKIKLSYIPYVNETYSSTSRYNSTVGTIYQAQYSGYSPVKVMFSDQSYAVNITNYSPDPAGASFYQSTAPLFIQNGKEIIFDRQITTPFTVFYDYIPADLRFRVIMRNNIPNLFSASAIDEVILKMKTINYDPYYDKLRKLDGSRYA